MGTAGTRTEARIFAFVNWAAWSPVAQGKLADGERHATHSQVQAALRSKLVRALRVKFAVLDGKIACFCDLLFLSDPRVSLVMLQM